MSIDRSTASLWTFCFGEISESECFAYFTFRHFVACIYEYSELSNFASHTANSDKQSMVIVDKARDGAGD